VFGLEGMGGPETHVHEIINVSLFYMALGRNNFDAGKSISHLMRANPFLRPLKGVHPEIFFGP
jgi:hypothetical protein